MTEELLEIRKKLSKKLKKDRFEHTIGVMYTAASLAMCYGEDVEKALTAGLLHDCAKYCSSEDQIVLCRKHGIELTESELEMPALIHAKLGAYLASHKYKIKDPDILDAITYHTTGRPGMTMLEKIIYIAEPEDHPRAAGNTRTGISGYRPRRISVRTADRTLPERRRKSSGSHDRQHM